MGEESRNNADIGDSLSVGCSIIGETAIEWRKR